MEYYQKIKRNLNDTYLVSRNLEVKKKKHVKTCKTTLVK